MDPDTLKEAITLAVEIKSREGRDWILAPGPGSKALPGWVSEGWRVKSGWDSGFSLHPLFSIRNFRFRVPDYRFLSPIFHYA
jgi:hypothetical protein